MILFRTPVLHSKTPNHILYNALYNAIKPSIDFFLLTTRRKVRLLKLDGSVCMFAIFAFNLTVQFRS